MPSAGGLCAYLDIASARPHSGSEYSRGKTANDVTQVFEGSLSFHHFHAEKRLAYWEKERKETPILQFRVSSEESACIHHCRVFFSFLCSLLVEYDNARMA